MAWDEAQEEYWAEVEKALRELHGVTTAGQFLNWEQDVELFVKDMLEFAQAAYTGGWDDAAEAFAQFTREQQGKLD